jgi:hypothetical protein
MGKSKAEKKSEIIDNPYRNAEPTPGQISGRRRVGPHKEGTKQRCLGRGCIICWVSVQRAKSFGNEAQARGRRPMTGGRRAVAGRPGACRIAPGHGPAGRSQNTPWGPWARWPCTPPACPGPGAAPAAAAAASAAEARGAGWACPRASRPGSSRRRRSRCLPTALVRSGMPGRRKTLVKRLGGWRGAERDKLAYLDQILALSLSDERLKLRRCERVDQTGL